MVGICRASILIHLDFLSISWVKFESLADKELQSLFTWIFYLFKRYGKTRLSKLDASILIHLDFLSIYTIYIMNKKFKIGFNPYSPGFSIYLNKKTRGGN